MQYYDGNSLGITALLDIDDMPIADGQHAPVEGVNGRMQILHCALLVRGLIHYEPI
jgi:hypothetical protein